MVQRYEIVLEDDLDGSKREVENFEFSLGGETFSLDLSKKHRDEIKRKLQPYIDAAQGVKTKARIRSAGKAPAAADKTPSIAHEVRQWAMDRNIQVPPRGRIPRSVLEEYETYHKNLSHVG